MIHNKIVTWTALAILAMFPTMMSLFTVSFKARTVKDTYNIFIFIFKGKRVVVT